MDQQYQELLKLRHHMDIALYISAFRNRFKSVFRFYKRSTFSIPLLSFILPQKELQALEKMFLKDKHAFEQSSYYVLDKLREQLLETLRSYETQAQYFLDKLGTITGQGCSYESMNAIIDEYLYLITYIDSGCTKRELVLNQVIAAYLSIKDGLQGWTDISSHYQEIQKFYDRIKEGQQEYLTHDFLVIREDFKDAHTFFSDYALNPVFSTLQAEIHEFIELYDCLEERINEWNQSYIAKELELHQDLFDNIDGKSLDQQQRRAVVVDEKYNLVVAGAGSGKTLTISGKVKYLVDKKGINAKDILLISYTKKAAEEMRERIDKRLGVKVVSSTFHALGKKIINDVENEVPSIFNKTENNLVKHYFKEVIVKNPKIINMLIEFYGLYVNMPKDISEFKNLSDYNEYCKNQDFTTLKAKMSKNEFVESSVGNRAVSKVTLQGEKVKSYEELMIANYLFLNGINYTYEKFYAYKTADMDHRQYQPDFYLIDYDIYLEHFGINRAGKTPWLSSYEEAKYLQGMKWKREKHHELGTILIETYSYYNQEGILLDKLEELLKEYQVTFSPRDYGAIFDELYIQKEDRHFKELIKLFDTFIGLFKSNGYTIDTFTTFEKHIETIASNYMRIRTTLFMNIAKDIYTYYENYLKENNLIDFDDMINQSTEYIKSGKWFKDYKYIIIDEYQDISISRYKLVKALVDQSSAKVLCVGDDWQSIYRFAGSDINLFKDFGEYFGYYELMKIEKTYRNSQDLINIAGSFVMENPLQLKKNLKSDNSSLYPAIIYGYEEKLYVAALRAIQDIVDRCGDQTDILLLGRNNFDINALQDTPEFTIKNSRNGSVKDIICNYYPDLKISFLTAHRSKGLEATNVIIINTRNAITGFPNQMADDDVLSYVLAKPENYPYAEERRLFYVAMTRTKDTTYILTPEKKPSVFIKELVEKQQIPIRYNNINNNIKDNPECPYCGGKLMISESIHGRFVRCSNFPVCEYKNKYIEIIKRPIKCPDCGDYLVKRINSSTKVPFYGCSTFYDTKCRGSRDINY